VTGDFKYKYEYHSPSGEAWNVYRLWFGFIPITHVEVADVDMYDTTEIQLIVDELNGFRIPKTTK